MAVEHPDYEVMRHEDSLELRRYAPVLTAAVTVDSDGYNEAMYAGFRLLADYIFGNNVEGGSIAMTAPVTASRSSGTKIAMTAPVTSGRVRNDELEHAAPLCTIHCEGEYMVRFTMPSQFASVEDLPRPADSRVELESRPQHLAAVVRFGGRMDEESVAQAIERLRDWMDREKLVPTGEPEAAQYDAPWKPGFLRHNEVLVPVMAAS